MRISRIVIAAGVALTRPAGHRAVPAARPRRRRCAGHRRSRARYPALPDAVRAAGRGEPGARGEGGRQAGPGRPDHPERRRRDHHRVGVQAAGDQGRHGPDGGDRGRLQHPHLASDLAVYRKQYGLPPCTAASGCLRIVNQQGKPSPVPRPDPTGWGVEATLDVSMVSAACPLCRILVVEANGPTSATSPRPRTPPPDWARWRSPTATAQRRRASPRATPRPTTTRAMRSSSRRRLWLHRRVVPGQPGRRDRGRRHQLVGRRTSAAGARRPGTPTAAPGAAAARPTWPSRPGSTTRTAPAAPSPTCPRSPTNVAIYNKRPGRPWLPVDGTSASSPIIAGVYGLAGNAATVRPGYEYAHAKRAVRRDPGEQRLVHRRNGASAATTTCAWRRRVRRPDRLGTPTASAPSRRAPPGGQGTPAFCAGRQPAAVTGACLQPQRAPAPPALPVPGSSPGSSAATGCRVCGYVRDFHHRGSSGDALGDHRGRQARRRLTTPSPGSSVRSGSVGCRVRQTGGGVAGGLTVRCNGWCGRVVRWPRRG